MWSWHQQNCLNPYSKKLRPTREQGHTLSRGGASVAVHLQHITILTFMALLLISWYLGRSEFNWCSVNSKHHVDRGRTRKLNLSIDSLQSSSSAVGWVVLQIAFPAKETSSSSSKPPTASSTSTSLLAISSLVAISSPPWSSSWPSTPSSLSSLNDHNRMVSILNKHLQYSFENHDHIKLRFLIMMIMIRYQKDALRDSKWIQLVDKLDPEICQISFRFFY